MFWPKDMYGMCIANRIPIWQHGHKIHTRSQDSRQLRLDLLLWVIESLIDTMHRPVSQNTKLGQLFCVLFLDTAYCECQHHVIAWSSVHLLFVLLIRLEVTVRVATY